MPGSHKRKPRRLKLSDKRQSERFIKTAQNIGVDESGKAFNKALKLIIPKKHKSANS
jgi:hypothetical protein